MNNLQTINNYLNLENEQGPLNSDEQVMLERAEALDSIYQRPKSFLETIKDIFF